MIGLLAAMAVLMVVAWLALKVGFLVVKGLLWLLLLPVRLLFYAILFPLFFVAKAVLGGVLLLVVAPIVALLGLLAAAAIALPLLPLVFLAFVVWVVVRLTRPVSATSNP